MTTRVTKLGGATDFTAEELKSADLNNTFEASAKTGMYFNEHAYLTDYITSPDVQWHIANDIALALDSSAGKIYKTTDPTSASPTWTEKGTGLTAAKTWRIVTNSNDPTYMIAFTYEAALKEAWYTGDAGETWTELTNPANVSAAATHWYFGITDSGRIYVHYYDSGDDDNNIQYTDNGGTNWTQLANYTQVSTYAQFIIIAPKNGFVLAGATQTADNGICYHTVDNGANWTENTHAAGTTAIGYTRSTWNYLYVDSDNYFYTAYLASGDGISALKWQGDDYIAASALTPASIYLRPYRLDATDLVLASWNSTNSAINNVTWQTATSFIMYPGALAQTVTYLDIGINRQAPGVYTGEATVSGEYIYTNGTVTTHYTDATNGHPIWELRKL